MAVILCACGSNDGDVTSVVPGTQLHDSGPGDYDAASPIEPRDEPVLPACLQGQAPEGCAERPLPPSLTDWVCPAGWLDVPGFTNADGDEKVPDGVAPFNLKDLNQVGPARTQRPEPDHRDQNGRARASSEDPNQVRCQPQDVNRGAARGTALL